MYRVSASSPLILGRIKLERARNAVYSPSSLMDSDSEQHLGSRRGINEAHALSHYLITLEGRKDLWCLALLDEPSMLQALSIPSVEFRGRTQDLMDYQHNSA